MQPVRQCSGRSSCGTQLHENVGNRWVGGGEKGGAEDGRDREIPGLSEARDATGDPYVSRAATGRARQELVRGQARTGVTGVRGLGGKQETGFLKLRRYGGEFRHS